MTYKLLRALFPRSTRKVKNSFDKLKENSLVSQVGEMYK